MGFSRVDLLAFGIPFGLAAGFSVTVATLVGKQALLLAFQDLGFTPFQVLCLPISVLCFRRAVTDQGWKKLSPKSRGLWKGTLALLLLGVVLASWVDIRRAPVVPYAIGDPQEARAHTKRVAELRDEVMASDDWKAKAGGEGLRPQFEQTVTAQGFESAGDFIAEANALGWYALLLNIVGFAYAATVFLYLVFRVSSPEARTAKFPQRLNNLVVAVATLILWLPLRVFSEWSNNFFKLDLSSFQALLPITAAMVAAVVLLSMIARPESFAKWWKIVTTALGLLVGLVFGLNLDALFFVARILANLEPLMWCFTAFILAISMFAFVKGIEKLP